MRSLRSVVQWQLSKPGFDKRHSLTELQLHRFVPDRFRGGRETRAGPESARFDRAFGRLLAAHPMRREQHRAVQFCHRVAEART